jgi:UDP-N-acetylmuramyl pentapeptide phosphotransferase/UDP-N-acetylglucosamine-1-phosphate transferase
MGDAGSAFLGFVFATLPLLAKTEDTSHTLNLAVAGVLLVWLFLFDSAYTFIRRVGRGEMVWQAHREHLYQRLVVSGYSHRRVAIIYGAISLAISIATAAALANPSFLLSCVVLSLVVAATASLIVLCRKRDGLLKLKS